MQITVRLFATLRANRFKEQTRQYSPGTTVSQVVEDLKILRKDVALILVNGQTGFFDQELYDNDILSLFPPVGGG
jgi:molybdopterin converting factor small subunit